MSPCTIKRGLLAVLLLVPVLSSIVLLLCYDDIFNYIYNSQLVLSPTSGSFPMWSVLPAPMIASMYLFHVLNPEEFSAGAKPMLEERGPYVFTEQHYKTNIVWNDNGTVSYKQVRSWHFLPEKSKGSLDDEVTILNPVAGSIGAMIQEKVAPFWRPGLDGILLMMKEKLFITKTVREIIFEGYHDPLFDEVMKIKDYLPPDTVPEGAIMDKFAFFYGRNGTDWTDGVWNMYTGAGDNSRVGKVHTWNYTENMFFPGECGKVEGGAGEFYPPSLNKTSIQLYSNDLCRHLTFDFHKEVDVKGIHSYEYVASKKFFANGSDYPPNACFEKEGSRQPSGVYDSSKCRFGAPVFISHPHFYQADPSYLENIESGLTPNASLHSTVFRVEPLSGVPTDVKARFQLNVLIEQMNLISMFKGVRRTYFPVMWFENTAGVPDDLVFKMKLMANLPDILKGVGWVQIGLAFAICLISTVMFLSRRKTGEDRCPILNQSHHEDTQEDSVFTDHSDQEE